MILKRKITNQFKKDFKKYRHNKSFVEEFEKVIKILCNQEKLPAKYKDHQLKWEYLWTRECHIKPDILLVYKIEKQSLELLLLRLWSHSELF